MPVQPVEILLGRERRQQGLRAGIVVGIVERLHRNLQQNLVALRARPLGELGGIRAVGRERQRHRRRQFHDGVGGLGGADAEAADHDGDHRHLRRLGAVGIGGIDGERFQPIRHHRDHAVAGFFQQPRVDPGHHGGSWRRPSALSGASPAITTSWRAPLEPSMMVTVFCSPGAAGLGAGFAPSSEAAAGAAAGLFVRRRRLAASRRAPSARRPADCR